jgi:integral membrane sensor domain MASE1
MLIFAAFYILVCAGAVILCYQMRARSSGWTRTAWTVGLLLAAVALVSWLRVAIRAVL